MGTPDTQQLQLYRCCTDTCGQGCRAAFCAGRPSGLFEAGCPGKGRVCACAPSSLPAHSRGTPHTLPPPLLCSDADALRWALHVAQALQYLHESRPAVVHRDLKLVRWLLGCVGVVVRRLGQWRPALPCDIPGTHCPAAYPTQHINARLIMCVLSASFPTFPSAGEHHADGG